MLNWDQRQRRGFCIWFPWKGEFYEGTFSSKPAFGVWVLDGDAERIFVSLSYSPARRTVTKPTTMMGCVFSNDVYLSNELYGEYVPKKTVDVGGEYPVKQGCHWNLEMKLETPLTLH